MSLLFLGLGLIVALLVIALVRIERVEKRVKAINESNTPTGLIKLFKAIVEEQLDGREDVSFPKPEIVVIDTKGDLKKPINEAATKPKGKTTKEWLQELPDGYRELAMKYERDYWDTEDESMSDALSCFCSRNQTEEGNYFWSAVHDHYWKGVDFLPPLPAKEKKPRKPAAKKPTNVFRDERVQKTLEKDAKKVKKPVKRPSKK